MYFVMLVFSPQAEEMMMEKNLDKEYAGISGLSEFCKVAAELAFGADSDVIKARRVSHTY